MTEGRAPSGSAPAKEPLPPAKGEPHIGFGGYWFAALLFGGILTASAILGYGVYRVEVMAARRDARSQMQAVGRLKSREIEHWLEERRIDIASAATGPRIALDIERWQATGRVAPSLREWISRRLDRIRAYGDYVEVAIVGRDGAVLLSGRAEKPPFRFPWVELAREAMKRQAVLFSPLARPAAPDDRRVFLDAIAPLTAEDERGSRVVGAMVNRINPEKYLFPLIQSWPTGSRSAETLLVRRDGDEVLFLNELRHRSGTALQLRASDRVPELIAAKAVRGERGVVEGVDYRGVPVLASIDAVEGTPWILVSKIDKAEADAPLRDFLRIYLAFLAGAAAIAGLTARSWWRGVREAALRREHESIRQYVSALKMAEAEREKLIESLTRAIDDVKTLRGIVPICASCKRIRDDAGYWSQVEQYVSKHTEAQFSHGICPECLKKLYPEYAE